MRLTVIGTGYLGLTHAVCMADLGHDVMGLDVDADKVARAGNGEVPFFEPSLEPLLRKNLDAGRLRFTTRFREVADFGDVHFLCVGTPQAAGGEADLCHLHAAADALAPRLRRPCLVIGKSTVPVGTARRLAARIRARAPAGDGADVAWNPEFLREGFAVEDSFSPDRLVFGVASQRSAEVLQQVYAKLLDDGVPALVMDLETAELVKVSANAFLATKISFINAMAEICEQVGADVVHLTDALARDNRIGKRFLAPGLGFGGGCLPKDLRAFRSTARQLGVESVVNLLGEVDAINLGRRSRVTELARDVVGGALAGRRLAVLGLAFKPGSDDVRDSPSLHVCRELVREGALVSVHDPVAMRNAARIQPDVRYASSVSEAAANADAVLHLTEWADYRVIDPTMLATVVAQRNMIDARCTLDESAWRAAGWSFRILGRREQRPGNPAPTSPAAPRELLRRM
ncbi:MAG: UDP-glucose dehydrogenase family protein [Streptosporangiales bacterium]